MRHSLSKAAVSMMLFSASISLFGCGSPKKEQAPTPPAQTSEAPTKPSEQPKPEKPVQANDASEKAVSSVEAQIPHIYDNAIIVPMKNGAGTKVIGKVSVLKISSSEVTDEALEDWFFNYAEKNVRKGENWNWAVIVYTDKPNTGIFYNSVLNKDAKLKEEKDGTWSLVGTDAVILVEDKDNPKHLKEFNMK